MRMINRWTLRNVIVTLGIILAGVSSLRAAGFEGLVEYEVKGSDGKTNNLTYKLKAPRLRMETQDAKHGKGIILFNTDQKVMYILSPEQKAAIKQTIHDAPHASTSSPSPAKKFEFVNTGKKETIAGHTCTVYSYKDEMSEGEICTAQGMGAFLSGA